MGSYCERIERVDAVTDPFGKVTEYPRVDYRIVEFALGSDFPAIEIHGPSRGTGDLFVHLAEFVGYDLLVSPIRATVVDWLSALERHTAAMQVTALEVAAIALTTQVSGTLWVEGTSDVRSALRDVVVSRLMWNLAMAPLPDAAFGLCSTTRYAAASSSRAMTSTIFS